MKILLAIDESACSEAATGAVLTQFPPEHTEVRVLHSVEHPECVPPSLAFAAGPFAAGDILDIGNSIRHQAADLVARTVERLQSARFHASADIRDGDARQAILDCAAEWHPDLIVLGSHGRRGLDQLLLGSVSKAVVRDAPCAVEVVRAKS